MLSTAVDSRGTGALSLVRIVIGVLILVTAGIALCWARRRLIVPSFLAGPTLAHQISHVLSGGAKEILLVGPPRTRKDEAVIKAVRRATGKAPAERIRLLDKELTNDYIESEVARINLLASENNGARLAPDGRLWIHISNLESQLMNATSRTQVLKLLEQLREGRDDLPQKVLVVTTSVDPIANFEEVFDTERKGVYDDVIPEVGLSRSSLILSRFLRCYVPILCDKSADKRWQKWLNYRPEDWKDTLALEAEGYEPLLEIAAELARCEWTDGHPSLDELARAFTARAQATYQLLWTSCTRSEKLVLIQLAQEGLVNPKCHDVVARLMAKGMVVSKPGLTVFNYTFRQFLRGIERDQVVTEWERVEGTGLWVTAGRLVGSGLLAGGLFFLLTQDLSVQSLLPIISGTGVFGLPIVRELMAYFSSRSSDAPRAA
jgi:hypothetical protein